MSRAKALIERMCPAPVVEPKPGVKPSTAPGRPAPRPLTRPNPFRRRDIRPGEEPRPKAMESILGEGKKAGLKQPAQGGKTSHAFSKSKKMIAGKSSGAGASGLTAKKAFKK